MKFLKSWAYAVIALVGKCLIWLWALLSQAFAPLHSTRGSIVVGFDAQWGLADIFNLVIFLKPLFDSFRLRFEHWFLLRCSWEPGTAPKKTTEGHFGAQDLKGMITNTNKRNYSTNSNIAPSSIFAHLTSKFSSGSLKTQPSSFISCTLGFSSSSTALLELK